MGIDPDNHGAVAVVRLQADEGPLLEALGKAIPQIFDMPLEKVAKGKRIRKWVDHYPAWPKDLDHFAGDMLALGVYS